MWGRAGGVGRAGGALVGGVGRSDWRDGPDAFLRMLASRGYDVPAELLARDVTRLLEPSGALQKTLIHIYRGDPLTRQVCELLVDLDEGIQEWRYRHVKMVQRTIGVKMGTGGSSGAEYLARTLMIPLFPDLWEIRSEL